MGFRTGTSPDISQLPSGVLVALDFLAILDFLEGLGRIFHRRDTPPPFPHGSYRAGSLRFRVAVARGRWRWFESAAQGVVLELLPGLAEDVLVGVGAGEVDDDAAHGKGDLRAYLEEFEADGSAGRFSQSGAF